MASLSLPAFFAWSCSATFTNHAAYGYNSPAFHAQNGANDVKMGLRKNFSYLAKSKYLICIAVIVVMYNIAINLVEVVWKDQVKQLYPKLQADL